MPATEETWREKVAKNWINTRLAHEGMMLDKIQRQGALVRRLIRKTQNGTLGTATDEPEDAVEADDVGVMIGNEIHNHYGQQPTPSAPSASVSSGAGTEARPATVETAETPLWKKAAALAAVMAGTGGAAGLASYLTTQPAEKPPAVEIPAPPGYGVEVEKQPITDSTEAAK